MSKLYKFAFCMQKFLYLFLQDNFYLQNATFQLFNQVFKTKLKQQIGSYESQAITENIN